mmetsp:Transcript_6569/g.11987  ORF Transcript_6569/g.11987 Transcript_6569/m.11987 type:complete len:122 (-) Transcript_6569:2240-2605(-)
MTRTFQLHLASYEYFLGSNTSLCGCDVTVKDNTPYNAVLSPFPWCYIRCLQSYLCNRRPVSPETSLQSPLPVLPESSIQVGKPVPIVDGVVNRAAPVGDGTSNRAVLLNDNGIPHSILSYG